MVRVEQIPSGRWIVIRWAPWSRNGLGSWLVVCGPVDTKQAALIAISDEPDLAQVPELLPYRILAEAERLQELRGVAAYFRGFGPPPLWDDHSSRFIFEMREHARHLIGGGR